MRLTTNQDSGYLSVQIIDALNCPVSAYPRSLALHSQTGCSPPRLSWSCLWSSPPSPSWSSLFSCSSCPKVTSSTSQASVRHSQVCQQLQNNTNISTLSLIAGMNNELMWWDESIWSETFYCSPAGFTAFAACLIFTLHRKDILNDTRDLRKGHFGYCFVLAWICVPLLFISAFLYAHLRKRQWEESFGSQWSSVGRLRMNEWLWKSHYSLYFQTFSHVQQSEDWRRTFCHHWGISVCGTSSFCPVVITPPDQERNKVVTAQTVTGLMPYIDNVLVTPAV